MILNNQVFTREVLESDASQINHLIQNNAHVHQHLDWWEPTDWIGHMPFFVAEWNYQLIAALSCPLDLPSIAWIRLFVVSSLISNKDAWRVLWDRVCDLLMDKNVRVAVLPFYPWFQKILTDDGFSHTGDVILLQWDRKFLPPIHDHPDISIRKMNKEDLRFIHQIDQLAFEPIWQNSWSLLETALSKAVFATVAESPEGIIGYQISTANSSGGHLARLAVLPEWQGQRIGYALTHHVLTQFANWGYPRVTVSTQSDNVASLELYRQVGFRETDVVYPVFQVDFFNKSTGKPLPKLRT